MAGRLLVVDDDVDGLHAFAEALRRRLPDVKVDTASSGQRALEVLTTMTVDLIVTDFRMPGMDGLELLRRVKGQQPRCTVFLVTGCDTGIADQARQLGAAGFAEKPVVLEEFVPLLRKAMLEAPGSYKGPGSTVSELENGVKRAAS
jgi:DNA-binding NtrC family response regulator